MQGEEILALSTAPELTAPVMGVTVSAILDSVFYALVLWGPPNKCPTSQPPLHWCLWPGPKWPGCLTHPSPHLFPSKSWPVVSVVIPCFQAGAVFCVGHLAVSSGEYAQIPKRYARTCHLSFILCLYNLFKVAF